MLSRCCVYETFVNTAYRCTNCVWNLFSAACPLQHAGLRSRPCCTPGSSPHGIGLQRSSHVHDTERHNYSRAMYPFSIQKQVFPALPSKSSPSVHRRITSHTSQESRVTLLVTVAFTNRVSVATCSGRPPVVAGHLWWQRLHLSHESEG